MNNYNDSPFQLGLGIGWRPQIALAIDRVPVVGVVSSPALGRRWWGASGLGASVRDAHGDRVLKVSSVGSLADASISYNSLKGWDEAGRLEEEAAASDRPGDAAE